MCPDTFELLSRPRSHFCIPLSDFCWFNLSQSPFLKQVLLLNFFGSLLFSVIAMLPSGHLFGLGNPGSRFVCFFFFAIIKKIVGENIDMVGKAWSLKDLLVILGSLVADIRIHSRQFKQKWLYYGALGDFASQAAQWQSACPCRRHKFSPWVSRMPSRRKWQPTPVSLPGQSHGERNLVRCSPWGQKELETTEWLSTLGNL